MELFGRRQPETGAAREPMCEIDDLSRVVHLRMNGLTTGGVGDDEFVVAVVVAISLMRQFEARASECPLAGPQRKAAAEHQLAVANEQLPPSPGAHRGAGRDEQRQDQRRDVAGRRFGVERYVPRRRDACGQQPRDERTREAGAWPNFSQMDDVSLRPLLPGRRWRSGFSLSVGQPEVSAQPVGNFVPLGWQPERRDDACPLRRIGDDGFVVRAIRRRRIADRSKA